MKAVRRLLWIALAAVLPALGGCSGSNEEPPVSEEGAGGTGGLQPFDVPKLADLDAQNAWSDLPVLDALELLQADLAKTAPTATVAEVLSLKNDSDASNAKILDTFGRLPKSDAEVDYGAPLTRFMKADVKSTNPIMFNSVEEGDIGQLIAYGLTSFDWNLKPFALKEFVKSWQTNKDQTIHKMILRDDVVWSDGVPITAHDIVFSFKTIMDDRVPVPAMRSQTDQIRWVEAYDDHTLVYFFKESSPTNVWNVNFYIIPKHIYEKELASDPTLQNSDYHIRLENEPVVGGPYKIVKRTRGQEIVLERRDDYYMHNGKQVRPKPYFKTIRFRITTDPNVALLALKKGDLEEMLLMPDQWVTQTNDDEFYRLNTKVRGTEWVYFYFGWNMKHKEVPFFAEKKVREALSYAFDYDEMLRSICYGLYEPCGGIFHSTAWMAPKPMPAAYRRDIAKAETLLKEAGWVDSDGDGVREKEIDGKTVEFEFTIVCSPIPQRVAICNLLRQNLEEVEIKCNVRTLEAAALSDALINHNYHANFGGWGTGADPATLKNIWQTGETRNFNGYSNSEVDRLIKQAELEFDRNKQAELYAEIHRLIYADQPVTFLYFQPSMYAFNKQVRGYRFSPRGPFHYSPGISSLWRAAAH